MIPVVALLGRPNVGKSTLFNRLTRTQNALVADAPGLTRDRQYGEVKFANKTFLIVDTGGIGVEDKAVDELMSQQSQVAVIEADSIIFMVDARDGLTSLDEKIIAELRKSNKPLHLVINKIDGLDPDIAWADFQRLGLKQINMISATHGRGIESLLMYLTEELPEDTEPSDNFENHIKVTCVGRPNVGKSTLVNRILGEERMLVYDMPGTTRDSVAIPFERDDKKFIFIDTAGIRRRGRVHEKIEKFSIIKTIQAIKESHVCLMLIDASEGLTDQDLHLLGLITESGKALVLVVNKWDGLEADHKTMVQNEVERRLSFVRFAKVRYISALHGSGVGVLFKDIEQAYLSATKKFATPMLTQMLQEIVAAHPPPSILGRRIKLRYAHLGGQNPPLIIIHGNQLKSLPESYKRYLINAFSNQLKLIGTPLQVEFKGGQNPFKDKINKLTPRQIKSKKRLFKHVKRGK